MPCHAMHVVGERLCTASPGQALTGRVPGMLCKVSDLTSAYSVPSSGYGIRDATVLTANIRNYSLSNSALHYQSRNVCGWCGSGVYERRTTRNKNEKVEKVEPFHNPMRARRAQRACRSQLQQSFLRCVCLVGWHEHDVWGRDAPRRALGACRFRRLALLSAPLTARAVRQARAAPMLTAA